MNPIAVYKKNFNNLDKLYKNMQLVSTGEIRIRVLRHLILQISPFAHCISYREIDLRRLGVYV